MRFPAGRQNMPAAVPAGENSIVSESDSRPLTLHHSQEDRRLLLHRSYTYTFLPYCTAQPELNKASNPKHNSNTHQPLPQLF